METIQKQLELEKEQHLEDLESLTGLENKIKLFRQLNDLLNDYSDEAEHQDGYQYWNNFETLREFLEDLNLYLTHYDKELF